MEKSANVIIGLAVGAFSVAGVGWGGHDFLYSTFAEREPVLIVGAKADFILDRQMAATASEIGYLERKRNKSTDEFERLRYLREQYEQMRRIRSGR